MLPVICFGEALIDMLSNRQPGDAADAPESFSRFAGGAPANVAVAIARLGGQSQMVGKVGADMFGDFIQRQMQQAGVDTSRLLSTSDANTALAFVSLDAAGERSFSFYRNPSADLLFAVDEWQPQWFEQTGILHFCSNTLTHPEITQATQAGVELASQAGWLVSFDFNLRHNLWPTGIADIERIRPFLSRAQLVKMSREEWLWMQQTGSETGLLDQLWQGQTRLLIVTDGSQPLQCFVRGQPPFELLPPEVATLDSTAAGDAFMGGLLFQLASQNIGSNQLAQFCENQADLQQALFFAARCGGYAAGNYGAFAAMPDQQQLAEWP
ncbi:carbohydrate kinase family protein [Oceanobacter mangrovi]|uniref:carbohydrate kinase family protein n=1 Tax=Oceanobacter mangrovi TaxID=2862510 RepID=UPI001C8ED103|nr:carbohydrate kinase [Oceanobacter mangrovi]